jgi:hypothetical protein
MVLMEISSGFRESVQHNPNLILREGLVVDAPQLDIANQRLINHFVDHIDDAIRAAVANLNIFMILWEEYEVGNGIFDYLFARLSFEQLFYVLIQPYLPSLV